MSYERTVKAAVAETQSKFKLAEALALEIPPQRRGPKVGPAVTVTECLMDAALEIKRAGGEVRSWQTLSQYRDVALWVSHGTVGNSTDERRLTFRWIKGVSFSAHREASESGMSYAEFAAMDKKTSQAIRERAGTTKSEPTPQPTSWTPEQRATVARELMADPAVAEQVVADPGAKSKVWDALDQHYADSPKPVKPAEPDATSNQLALVWEFRKLHVGMKNILDLAADPNAVVNDTQREAVLAEIKWLRNALEMVEIGLTSEPLHEAVAEFLANQEG